MRNIKLTVAYDGTEFAGWQRQPNRRTVQQALEQALARLLRQRVQVRAASRTDKGVHAVGQVACFSCSSRLPVETLQRAINAWLPNDVAVTAVKEVPLWFHPNRDCAAKSYRYLICNGNLRNVFLRRYCWQYVRGPLDVQAMDTAAGVLHGVHDFRSFQSRGSPRENTVRSLFRVRVTTATPAMLFQQEPFILPAGTGVPGSCTCPATSTEGQGRAGCWKWIMIEVVGDGFLYQMVRTLVGTLVEVGRGKRPVEWVADVLAAKDRCAAGPTAPPHGLFLAAVDYAGKDQLPTSPPDGTEQV